MKKQYIFFPILFCSFFTLSLLSAQTTVTFLNPQPAAPATCGDTWTENGVPQSFENLSGSCSFDYSGGNFWLFPATAVLDLSGLGTIDSVQVDLIDYCGIGCSYARFYNAGVLVDSVGNTTVSTQETLRFVNSGSNPVDEMKISSFEGQFQEIRIYHTTGGPSVCPADPDVHTEDGDVYVEDSCHGVILKSPNGTCYRIRVDDNGGLTTEQVACPN